MFFVYALYNRANEKIYIGQTADLEKRIAGHNQKRGNHYTAKVDGRWILIYKEEVVNRSAALVREKQLKSYQGRQFLKQYIPS